MTEPLKAVVVDSEAAREIVKLILGIMVQPDECLTVGDVDAAIKFSNEVIETYLSDPPYLEELLEEYISISDWTFETLVQKLGELIDGAAQYIYYDICEVKETFIADDLGTVMLMI